MTYSPQPVRGPAGNWLLGNLPDFGNDILGFLQKCAREYGDFVWVRMGLYPAIVLSHPDLIEEVLVTNSRNFHKHSFFWKHVRSIFGEGLLTSEGDFWRRQRRMAQPAFHRDRINSYGKLMVDYTERLLQDWKEGEIRDIHQQMMKVTSRIVTRALFNTEVDAHEHQVDKAFQTAIEEIAVRFRRPIRIPEFLPTPGNFRYKKSVKEMDRLIYGIIAERRAAKNGNDLLSMLLQAQDEDGTRMTDQQLRDEAITLFLAGHETTAIALTWTFYLLSKHPEAQQKLRQELLSVLGGRRPEVADLASLRYTEMVVQESMRLYPPAYAFGREAIADCTIAGIPVRKGTTVFMSQWVLHRDSRYFDQPEEFHPERWADGLAKRLPRFAYFPFGGGPRGCIGNSFAMMEAILLLAVIAQKFRLELVPDQPLEILPAITLRPRHGVRMMLKKP